MHILPREYLFSTWSDISEQHGGQKTENTYMSSRRREFYLECCGI